MRDSSPLVILVLLICLLGGGSVLYLVKVRNQESNDDAPLTGQAFTVVTEMSGDEEWKEHIALAEESTTAFIEGVPLTRVPGRCKLRAQVVGSKGDLLFQEEFSGGHRLDVRSGKKSSHKEAGPGLLELHCERYINGRDIATQYYRVLQGRLILVRLEDSRGRAVRNDDDPPVGPRVPARDAKAWEASLSSPDPGEVLWALLALHADGAPEGIARRIAELTASPNPWIAEAAKAATR